MLTSHVPRRESLILSEKPSSWNTRIPAYKRSALFIYQNAKCVAKPSDTHRDGLFSNISVANTFISITFVHSDSTRYMLERATDLDRKYIHSSTRRRETSIVAIVMHNTLQNEAMSTEIPHYPVSQWVIFHSGKHCAFSYFGMPLRMPLRATVSCVVLPVNQYLHA